MKREPAEFVQSRGRAGRPAHRAAACALAATILVMTSCSLGPVPLLAYCGDGLVTGEEVCDDGNTTAGDGCSSDCMFEERCGNGVVDLMMGEVCDDGNATAGDGCSASCQSDESCGNGIVDGAAGEQCDHGDTISGDGCSSACLLEYCGNGVVDPGEWCDDGNRLEGDGCPSDCWYAGRRMIAAGFYHTCALLDTGAVRCWGDGEYGQLGYGNTNDIGDDELPSSVGNVDVGGIVVQLAAGERHTCALLDTGAVRCWGDGEYGQLGYGNTSDIGEDELPSSVGDVDVGGTVVQLVAGFSHTCALLETGTARCWGDGASGKLGYGNTSDIGDNELPSSAGDVNVGGTVVQLAAGSHQTCAVLETGTVRCWGLGRYGRLGYGNTSDIGDNELPSSVGDVDVGGTVVQLAAGGVHTCALLENGPVRCWGLGGVLGYGNTSQIGDDELPSSAGDVDVGGALAQLSAGGAHTCALLETGAVRCWGFGYYGQLGYGNTSQIGDNELPSSAGDVPYL